MNAAVERSLKEKEDLLELAESRRRIIQVSSAKNTNIFTAVGGSFTFLMISVMMKTITTVI